MAFSANKILGADLYSVDDAAKFQVGTVTTGIDPALGEGEFIYLKGVASLVAGETVTFKTPATAVVRAVAAGRGTVAVALAATVANKFGWFQIRGVATVKVAALFADNAAVFLTATAGTVDDAVVAADKIDGARGASAIDTPATGFAYINLNYPGAYGNSTA